MTEELDSQNIPNVESDHESCVDSDVQSEEEKKPLSDTTTTAGGEITSTRKRKYLASEEDDTYIKTEREKQLMFELFGDKKKLLDHICASDTVNVKSSTEPAIRKPVWNDSDDENVHCDDVIDYNKKGAPEARRLGKYKVHLEKTFHNVVLGKPAWADVNRDREVDSDEELLQSVGHLAKPSISKLLPSTLQFKRMKDLNRATYAEGPGITGVEFHPKSSVALVTGASGVVSIYSIDGQKNDKLHSMCFDNFSVKMCRISNDGTEALLGGTKKFCYSYDLMTGTTQRIFMPKGITKFSQFELSPCGKYVCVIGRFGEVHLLNYSSKELLCTFKQEHPSTAVAFTTDSMRILSHSSDAQINIFDIRSQKVLHRFYDEGCVNGSSLAISPNGQLLASGSEQGVVNIYETDQLTKTATPIPIKTLFNLTTAISATKFNHSSEILAYASKHIDDAVKLVHLPSGTVYKNFPGTQGNIGSPSVISFSPLSGYLAIGNLKKEVTLYRLKHYSNY